MTVDSNRYFLWSEDKKKPLLELQANVARLLDLTIDCQNCCKLSESGWKQDGSQGNTVRLLREGKCKCVKLSQYTMKI